MKVLITGSIGQIGWELARCFPSDWTVIALDRASLDLARPATIAGVVAGVQPDAIINAAAYTAVDRAETEQELANRINGESVGQLAAAAKACGAVFVHFSTDYIFDGTKRTPYLPDDQPNPQSVYGHSKLLGEQATMTSGANWLILRTCWVYAMRGRNFVLAILRQSQKQPSLRIVNDQTGSPTWARAIARATAQIVTRHVAGPSGGRHLGGREGVYHLACGGATTWFDFADAIFREAKAPLPTIVPVTAAEYGAPAQRPAYSVLDCSRTTSAFGVTMPAWSEALREAMTDRAALNAILTPPSTSA